MTKQCCICGKEFKMKRADQKTCGDKACQRELKLEYLRIYSAERRKVCRNAINEYNRIWMRNYRARIKAEKEIQLQPQKEEHNADSYAERQKAKTLQITGKVDVTCG